jgi:hypothetical protein
MLVGNATRNTMERLTKYMKAIEATATVSRDGTLTVSIPVELEPGQHRVVVVVEEAPVHQKAPAPLDLPTLKVGQWPKDLSLRREDIYGDWGR